MEYRDFVGHHILSGIELGMTKTNTYELDNVDAGYIRFILDGVTYEALEDPDDGYRQYCTGIYKTDNPCKFKIPPVAVEIVEKEGEREDDYLEGLVFRDIVSKQEILKIGTNYWDSYYPTCVFEWHPERLALNIIRNIIIEDN